MEQIPENGDLQTSDFANREKAMKASRVRIERHLARVLSVALLMILAARRCGAAFPVLIPEPAGPWTEAKRIMGDGIGLTRETISKLRNDPSIRKTFRMYNDFCLIKDRIGRWHCIGILHDHGVDDALFHAISDRIDGPYVDGEKIRSGLFYTGVTQHMWAPCALWKDRETALMFYANIVQDKNQTVIESSIRALSSRSPILDEWSPMDLGHGEGNIALREPSDRDPEVIWDSDRHLYFMYYVVGDGWKDREKDNVVRVRYSHDLVAWSEPSTVMPTPPGYRSAESVFVLKRDGWYYLWVCGFDYGRMSLYISDNPMDFGDPVVNRVAEQSGHAPEIVFTEGEYWMGCSAVASHFGNGPAEHDLGGIYIQKLKWRPATAAENGKITRGR